MLLFKGFGDIGLLVLRVFLGTIFISHGMPKLTMSEKIARGMSMSNGFILFLGLIELFSGLALVLGFYTEIGALLIGIVMLGALWHKMFKWEIPFVAMDKTGWEFDFILLGAAIAILFLGAGRISLDALFGLWP